MKKSKYYFLLALPAMLSLTSCLKEHDVNIGEDNKSDNVLILQFIRDGLTNTNSGLANFDGALLSYSAKKDTAIEVLNVAVNGPNANKRDIAVTVAVDPTKALDNFVNDEINYEVLPDSVYHLLNTSVVVPAGERVAHVNLVVYTKKIDPNREYILPVVISKADGINISSNYGTVYLHKVGWPLAGTYDMKGKRYNYKGTRNYAGGAFPTDTLNTNPMPETKKATPEGKWKISIDYANLGGNNYHYKLTLDPTKPNEVQVEADFLSAVSNFKVWVHTYDPVNREIHLVTSYNNQPDGSGDDRIVEEIFTLQ
ncbi:MAG: DUF1735 domain-containing protein [Chitinophagaceae bacterium]